MITVINANPQTSISLKIGTEIGILRKESRYDVPFFMLSGYIYSEDGGVVNVTIIVVGNRLGNLSSNPRQGCSIFNLS